MEIILKCDGEIFSHGRLMDDIEIIIEKNSYQEDKINVLTHQNGGLSGSLAMNLPIQIILRNENVK